MVRIGRVAPSTFDYRLLFMRPGLSYFDPYIPQGRIENIVKEQWPWTGLKRKVVDTVASYILKAYCTF